MLGSQPAGVATRAILRSLHKVCPTSHAASRMNLKPLKDGFVTVWDVRHCLSAKTAYASGRTFKTAVFKTVHQGRSAGAARVVKFSPGSCSELLAFTEVRWRRAARSPSSLTTWCAGPFDSKRAMRMWSTHGRLILITCSGWIFQLHHAWRRRPTYPMDRLHLPQLIVLEP